MLATKFAYRFAEPRRGDAVLFEAPNDGAPTIKRVVGLPGDRVAVKDGVLFVNGERQREGYVDYNLTDSTFLGPMHVPEGHVYLMGDNRMNSLDSRSYGPVPEGDLLGKVPCECGHSRGLGSSKGSVFAAGALDGHRQHPSRPQHGHRRHRDRKVCCNV